MKKLLQLMFCAGILTALLVGTALAAGTSTNGYTTAANDNCTVTYDAKSGKYTAAYNGADLKEGNQYVLLVVKGTADNYSVGENTIMYIDQTATENGVNFQFIPMRTPDCVVLLGGEFSSGASPKILGTLIGQGVTVSGTVTSYNPNEAVTVELYDTGTTASPAYTTTIEASSGSGQVTQNFALTGVATGTYDLKVTKAGHAIYWVTGIPVGEQDLTIDEKITLPGGDINGDGNINVSDLVLLTSVKNYNKGVTEADNAACDINGDGNINVSDLVLLTSSANYNNGEIVRAYGG